MTSSCSATSRTHRSSSVVKLAAVVGMTALCFLAAPALRAQESTAADAAKSRDLVNSARSAAGLGALASHAGLDTIARAQAQRMAERDAIYHNPNLKADADAQGVNWQYIGENVGVGPDVQAVHDAFMASPGHHQNVVYGNYNAIGVGVVVGRDGSVFVAHAFAGIASAAPVVPLAPVVAPPTAPAPAPAVAPVVAAPAPQPAAPKTVAPAPSTAVAVVGGVVNTELVVG